CFFFFSSRRRHTRFSRDWSSDVCSSDLVVGVADINRGENITLLLLERANTVVGDIPHLRTGHYTTGMNRSLSRDNTLHPQVGIGVPTHKPPTGRLPDKYAPEHFQHD